MAAQLSLTNLRSFLLLWHRGARATSPFPVLVSPSSKTVESLGATVSTSSRCALVLDYCQ